MSKLVVLLQLLVTLALLPSQAGDRKKAIHDLRLDEMRIQAKDFAFRDGEGHERHLKEFVGKPLILHFWASWCTSCAKELPQLAGLSARWSKENVVFLPMSVDTSAKKGQVLDFLKSIVPKISFWQVTPSESSKSYWAWGLPITYFVDAKGVIVARAMGARDWTAAPEAELKELFF